MFHQHYIKVTESERQSDISPILPSPNRRADRVLPFMLGSSYTRKCQKAGKYVHIFAWESVNSQQQEWQGTQVY